MSVTHRFIVLLKRCLRKVINFSDGSHGLEHPDYEVFVIDVKDKFIKTVKGSYNRRQKDCISISSSNRRVYLVISKFCQIDGHFEVDCHKKKSESNDKSSD